MDYVETVITQFQTSAYGQRMTTKMQVVVQKQPRSSQKNGWTLAWKRATEKSGRKADRWMQIAEEGSYYVLSTKNHTKSKVE